MLKWVGIGLGVIAVLVIGFIVGMALAPVGVREATRDIFIIILGVFQLITAVLLAALLVAVLYAVSQINNVARGNVLPKLDEAMVKLNEVLESTRTIAGNARETASNAVGTTQFVSERVVSPIIRVSSLVSGVAAAATSLARRDAPERIEKELP